jgi:hypothetical protein
MSGAFTVPSNYFLRIVDILQEADPNSSAFRPGESSDAEGDDKPAD